MKKIENQVVILAECIEKYVKGMLEKLEKMQSEPDPSYPQIFNGGLICGFQESLIHFYECMEPFMGDEKKPKKDKK